MGPLEVSLFGCVRISRNHGADEIRLTRVIQALFAYLLLYRNRLHPRNVLTNLFWGETSEKHARGCLNTALWRLRQILETGSEQPSAYLIINHLGEVGFNPESNYWLDTAHFENSINRLLNLPVEQSSLPEIREVEKALDLYRGDLLDSFYDDWALRERERMRFLYLNSLAYLMRFYKFHQQYEKSLVYGQRILSLDPLREEIHREMIRLYLENGQPALALRQYDFCSKALREEMNINPMEETQALFHQVAAISLIPVTASQSNSDQKSLAQLYQQLSNTSRVIESAQEQIQSLMEAVNAMMNSK